MAHGKGRDSRSADGKPESYFRGRKLHGRKVKIPEGYSGVIVQDDGQKEAMEGNSEERREDANSTEEHDEETATLQEKGQFDEIMVWGHESVAEEDDTFVKGVNEWIIFAEAVSIMRSCTTGGVA